MKPNTQEYVYTTSAYRYKSAYVMADNQDPQTDIFGQAQEAFSQLELDQKVRFLAQEAVSTACEAAQVLVDFVAEECGSLFETAQSQQPPKEESTAG